MSVATIQTRPWSRKEYEQLVSTGIFQPGEQLELLEGEILQRSPQGSAHATAVTLIENALRKVFGDTYTVRIQMPLALAHDSEPEPDIAIVIGSPRDYRNGHPTSAELIVEVADTTLQYDRGRKATLYAKANIQEYWILNLLDRQLEVCRQPICVASMEPSYQSHNTIIHTEAVFPIRFPQTPIAITDLLP